MLDAAKAEMERKHDQTSESPQVFRQGDIVRIKNETGRQLSRFSVVGLKEPIFLPSKSLNAFQREVTFRGGIPSGDFEGKFAVLLEPASVGRIVRAYVSGVVQVQVDIRDASHTCADVDPDFTDRLVSKKEGGSAQILWTEGKEGVQWAVVRLGTNCRICCHSSSSSSSTSDSGCREACPACAPFQGGCVMRFSVGVSHWDFIDPPPSCVLMSCFYDVFHQHGCTWSATLGKANSQSPLPFETVVYNTAVLNYADGSWSLEVMDPGGHVLVFKGGTFDCHTLTSELDFFSDVQCFTEPVSNPPGCVFEGIS